MKGTKKLIKRSFSFLVMLAMVLSIVSVPSIDAQAADNNVSGEMNWVNENYYDSIEEAETDLAAITAENVTADKADNYLSDAGEVVDIPSYSDANLATDFVRQCMVERRSSIQFVYKCGKYTTKDQAENLANAFFSKIVDNVFEETPNADEGDYLYWNMGSWTAKYSGKTYTDTMTFTIYPSYLSTAAQEAKVTNKVNSLLDGAFDGWEKHTDAYNAKTVYDWILKNFTYDTRANEDHSAYGGFINGKTVCQGYATASYRLLREMGVNNRLVASESHGWNIVQIGSKYYCFDATWGDDLTDMVIESYGSDYEDLDYFKYFFFLCNESQLKAIDEDGEHTRTSDYNNSTFNKTYPLATSNYIYSSTDDKTSNVGDVNVVYSTHIQSIGWQKDVNSGQTSGTTGSAKRLEAIKIKLTNTSGLDLGIEYKTHIQSYGWESTWKSNGASSGTSNQAKRLEAIKIRLTGADAAKYDIYYRVHAQSYGWLGWAKNGEAAGTAGQAKRLEAIQIKIVKKGEKPSGAIGYSYVEYGKSAQENGDRTGLVNYTTHVQTYGWQGYVNDGSLSGTYGEGKRLEGIRISLGDTGYSGGIQYSTHIQSIGWQSWKSNGAMSGTSGQSKRLEAIKIQLTGDVAKYYDVYYRVHAQTFGWLGWAKNGEPAGTEGYAKRLEAIQIVLVPKGSGAPGASSQAAYKKK